MDAFVAGAEVCATIRYDRDSDDSRSGSLGEAEYLGAESWRRISSRSCKRGYSSSM